MKIIGKLWSVSEPRELQSTRGNVKVVDAVITDGCDSFIVSAFDTMADKLCGEKAIPTGSIVVAHAEATVRDGKEGKTFQSIRLTQVSCLAKVIEAF